MHLHITQVFMDIALPVVTQFQTLYNAVLICEMCEAAKHNEFLGQLASCDNNKLYEVTFSTTVCNRLHLPTSVNSNKLDGFSVNYRI